MDPPDGVIAALAARVGPRIPAGPLVVEGTFPEGAYISARLDTTLGRGSAYVMTASHRLDGPDVVETYGPETGEVVAVPFRTPIRLYRGNE